MTCQPVRPSELEKEGREETHPGWLKEKTVKVSKPEHFFLWKWYKRFYHWQAFFLFKGWLMKWKVLSNLTEVSSFVSCLDSWSPTH